jgi:hypothetical protein
MRHSSIGITFTNLLALFGHQQYVCGSTVCTVRLYNLIYRCVTQCHSTQFRASVWSLSIRRLI